MFPSRSRILAEVISMYEISAWTDNSDYVDQICPKKVFPVKNRKSEHQHWILHIRISLDTKFQLKLKILIFWTKFAQEGYIWLKTKKGKQHHWILHIRIGLATKFQVKLTILIFWNKFAQKGYFQSKTEKVRTAM